LFGCHVSFEDESKEGGVLWLWMLWRGGRLLMADDGPQKQNQREEYPLHNLRILMPKTGYQINN
jgi:hypothetical protein